MTDVTFDDEVTDDDPIQADPDPDAVIDELADGENLMTELPANDVTTHTDLGDED